MKINKIFWERTLLNIVFDKKINGVVILEGKNEKYDIECIDGKVVINTTNTPEGQMLSADNYYLKYNNEIITISNFIIDDLDNSQRVFDYNNGSSSYIVTFDVNDKLELIIKTKFVIVNNKWKRRIRLKELNGKKKIISILRSFLFLLVNFLYKFFRIFCSNKRILFLTENSNKLTGNMNVLYNYMNGYNKCVFSKELISKRSLIDTLKEIYYISISKIIIVDNYVQVLSFLNISSNTKVIQLWHAGVGFKTLGYARFGLIGSPHPYCSFYRKYSKIIVDREDLIPIYLEVFGNKKENFLPCGIPRLDNYLNDDVIGNKTSSLYKKNHLLKIKKTIIFSPTFRGSGFKDAYYDFDKINLDKIYDYCLKNDFIFIIKMHPFIKNKFKIKDEYKDVIYDYSNLDINDLLYVCDIMITDYSSCAYEFSLFNRPIIFYRYDKDLYELNSPLCTIKEFENPKYEVKDFNDLFDMIDKVKDFNINNRFDNINKSYKNRNSCAIIKEVIDLFLGGN